MRKVLIITLLAAGLLAACAAPAGSTADLENQVAALQTQVAALSTAEHAEASAFDLAVAQYVLDTAGFHSMEEALAETQTIDPSYGGAVTRVHTVLSALVWPEDLHEEGTAFLALLEEFSAKIEADDGAGAVEVSAQVHEAQHNLSHSIGAWLGGDDDHGHGN